MGLVRFADDPELAVRHFQAAEGEAAAVGSRYLIGLAIGYQADAIAALDAGAGLKELLRALDWHRSTGSPLGITRIALRSLMPALSAFGLRELIVLLDARLPPAVFFDKARAAAALDEAKTTLGSGEVDRLRVRAGELSENDLVALLRDEVERALSIASPERRPG